MDDEQAEDHGENGAAPEPEPEADLHEVEPELLATFTEIGIVETRRAIEAILLVATDPTPASLLAQLLEVPVEHVELLCHALADSYEEANHGFQLVKVAGGWRFQTHPDMAPYVERFAMDGQSSKLSNAALETLAIVAYKQPISRAQVSAIRGVNVDAVLRTLVQRGYVDEVGRDTGAGQAVLFGTTPMFLERLGINTVGDLPALGDFVPSAEVVEALEQTLKVDLDPDLRSADIDGEASPTRPPAPSPGPTGDGGAGDPAPEADVAPEAATGDGRPDAEAANAETPQADATPEASADRDITVDADVAPEGDSAVDGEPPAEAEVAAEGEPPAEVSEAGEPQPVGPVDNAGPEATAVDNAGPEATAGDDSAPEATAGDDAGPEATAGDAAAPEAALVDPGTPEGGAGHEVAAPEAGEDGERSELPREIDAELEGAPAGGVEAAAPVIGGAEPAHGAGGERASQPAPPVSERVAEQVGEPATASPAPVAAPEGVVVDAHASPKSGTDLPVGPGGRPTGEQAGGGEPGMVDPAPAPVAGPGAGGAPGLGGPQPFDGPDGVPGVARAVAGGPFGAARQPDSVAGDPTTVAGDDLADAPHADGPAPTGVGDRRPDPASGRADHEVPPGDGHAVVDVRRQAGAPTATPAAGGQPSPHADPAPAGIGPAAVDGGPPDGPADGRDQPFGHQSGRQPGPAGGDPTDHRGGDGIASTIPGGPGLAGPADPAVPTAVVPGPDLTAAEPVVDLRPPVDLTDPPPTAAPPPAGIGPDADRA